MKLEHARESSNVEDRRGQRMGGPRRGGGIGLVGLIVVLALSYFTGQDPRAFLQALGGLDAAPAEQAAPEAPAGRPRDQVGAFVSKVLASTEDEWKTIFRESNRPYREPPLVLFTDGVRSACGVAGSEVGPFYCPADSKVYLDTSFFRTLAERFGASGDFAAAYVIAHEVGHHVQNVLGVSDSVQERREAADQRTANALSVRMELQADCYAGVWGHRASKAGLIEPGDFEEGMRAAAAIGDDNIQEMSQGSVTPETWTHGSGEQRQQWLRRGLQTGDPRRCETS